MTDVEFHRELEKAIQKEGNASWVAGDYSFRFSRYKEWCRYTWKGRALHITPREALYLYQRLVLGLKPGQTRNPEVIGTLRGKFGLKFLQDVLGRTEHNKAVSEKAGKESRGRSGRRSKGRPRWDWADGEWTEKERERFERVRQQAEMKKQSEAKTGQELNPENYKA
jgi:hypothetical protein